VKKKRGKRAGKEGEDTLGQKEEEAANKQVVGQRSASGKEKNWNEHGVKKQEKSSSWGR